MKILSNFILQLLKQSESEIVFLINLTGNSEEAVVQNVTGNVIEAPIRTHLSSTLFSTLQRPETYVGDLSVLDPELVELIERVVDKKQFTVVTVPVFKHKSKCFVVFLSSLYSITIYYSCWCKEDIKNTTSAIFSMFNQPDKRQGFSNEICDGNVSFFSTNISQHIGGGRRDAIERTVSFTFVSGEEIIFQFRGFKRFVPWCYVGSQKVDECGTMFVISFRW